jgi:hypothetical protein
VMREKAAKPESNFFTTDYADNTDFDQGRMKPKRRAPEFEPPMNTNGRCFRLTGD